MYNSDQTTTGVVTASGFTTTGTWTFNSSVENETVGIINVQPFSGTFNANDTSIMTSAAIAEKIENYGYITPSTLPTASTGNLGGIKIGTNLSIDESGVLSSTDTDTTYSIATTTEDGLMSSGDKGILDSIKGQKIHVRASYNTSTQVLSTNWQHAPHISNAADRAVELDSDTCSRYCLCEITMPRVRPYNKLLYFAIQNYGTDEGYWDARGGYGAGANPAAYAGHYDDSNNQNTMTWKLVVDLFKANGGNRPVGKTFKLGPKVKASGTAYIYGNATGQYIFKLTELDEITISGSPGCQTFNLP